MNPSYDDNYYGNEQWNDNWGGPYLNSLATLGPGKSGQNSFEVSIDEFIVQPCQKKKLRRKTRNVRMSTAYNGPNCEKGCDCKQHQPTEEFPPIIPRAMEEEAKPNNDPELATAWTKRQAIMNYESFQRKALGNETDMTTTIEVIEKSSLGIEGWALHNFGETSEDKGERVEASEEVSVLRTTSPEVVNQNHQDLGERSNSEQRGDTSRAQTATTVKALTAQFNRWSRSNAERRGGKALNSPNTATTFNSKCKCSCEHKTSEYFCASSKCRNNQPSVSNVSVVRPFGSTTIGHVGTEDGSPRSAITTPSTKATPQPKPSNQQDAGGIFIQQCIDNMPKILENGTNAQKLAALKNMGKALTEKSNSDWYLTDNGQAELLRMYEKTAKPPSAKPPQDTKKSPYKPGLFVMDYTHESKAMLSSASPGTEEEEWIEIEFTADTGACDTVMPRAMCERIPIQPSLQSLRGMKYEVADGKEIPNLGERRCLMWTDDAIQARHINMQVADVHKPLLSLSRCADMGFESRFGRTMGYLIDEQTGEVVPLARKGNLYVLRCWVRAAPFGRQDDR